MKEWLQKKLGKEVLYKCVRLWREFEVCKRKPDEKEEDNLDRFKRYYGRVKASCGTAKITEEILAWMNLQKKEDMFKDMCKELKLVLSRGLGTSKVEGKEKDKKVDNDQTVKKEEEEG